MPHFPQCTMGGMEGYENAADSALAKEPQELCILGNGKSAISEWKMML